MPYKNRDDQRQWNRIHREETHVKYEKRREYERERKNRHRVASYMLLPEPDRSRKLALNAKRRSYAMRWRVVR